MVTGGAGFIGSHLTQHLDQLGCDVRVLDDFSSGFASNLDGIDATCIEGSILDQDLLLRSMRGCSIVFHEAAMISVPQSFIDPQRCFEMNSVGTTNVLNAGIEVGCSRIVYASSAACYGSTPTLPSTETDSLSPESPYAKSKVEGEQVLELHAQSGQIDGVSLRYFNVFGTRQDPKTQYAAVVSAFADAIHHDKVPVMYGDGSQTRDFTPVANIVHANLLAASHPQPLKGAVFNVGTGAATSLLDLLRMMTGASNPVIDFQPPREGDVQHSCANISSVMQVLGYKPIVSTVEGIDLLINPKRE